MAFVVGETVGPYQLLEQLGLGGMATVYKAYHVTLERYVAIKVLHAAYLEDKNYITRFQREARLVAKLDHPNIVPIYDFSELEGRPYLVMKYIEGETLKDVLQRLSAGNSGLERGEVVRIAQAVGSALAYAHQQGVLHRDVKPSNVLIASTGQIYLADFGLARIAQAGSSTLTSETLVGTPYYISPEQALSQVNLDARTDVYSFGVMLYEMVVGRVPFSGDTPFAVIHDHLYTPLPIPHLINPDVPEAVEQVLFKALAKNRDDRYSGIEPMVAAFTEVMGSPASSPTLPAVPGAAQPVAGLATTLVSSPGSDSSRPGEANQPAQPEKGVLDALGMDGIPSYTPPSMVFTEPETGQAEQDTVSKKRNTPGWVIWLAVGVGLVVCALVIMSNRGVINQVLAALVPGAKTAGIAQGTPGSANGPTGSYPRDAWNAAVDGLALWQRHDYAAAEVLFLRADRLAGDSPAFYRQAGQKMADSSAWVPAASMYLNLYSLEGESMAPDDLNALRQSLFNAAAEPQAKNLFSKSLTQPVYKVDQARYELYQGNQEGATRELDTILVSPTDLARLPEARLVQAELYYHAGSTGQASNVLNNLMAQPNLPPWVETFAKDLLARIDLPG